MEDNGAAYLAPLSTRQKVSLPGCSTGPRSLLLCGSRSKSLISSLTVAMEPTPEAVARHDHFKNSPWRFLGYANEVGEALRPLVPVQFVWATYAVAIGYAAGDTYDKATWEYEVRNLKRNTLHH